MISIVTPSHNPLHLDRAAASISLQTVPLEWIIVPNGTMAEDVVAEAIRLKAAFDSPTMTIRVCGIQHSGSIGFLKLVGSKLAKGDIIVELDHDDELLPWALRDIQEAADKAEGSNVFIYSDTAYLQHPGFRADVGWTYRPFDHGTTQYTVLEAKRVTARTLAEISYAPHHVRAWTKDLYLQVKGHDPKFGVLDDLDIMQRCYLVGAEFIHIPKPLYVYHVNERQESLLQNGTIQVSGTNLYAERFQALVEEECRRLGVVKADLGGGLVGAPGWLTIDVQGSPNLVADATEWLEMVPDGSIGAIRAHDFLEHLPGQRIVRFMNAAYKALMPGGYMLTVTPSVCDQHGRVGRGAFQDPTHVSYWSENNFWYFTNPNFRKYAPDVKCEFNAIFAKTYYPTPWHEQNQIPYCHVDLQKPPVDGTVGFGYYR